MIEGGKLWFPLDPVVMIAEYTAGQPEHMDSFSDQLDGKTTGPAIMWVKDAGTYLMSNARQRPEGDVIYGRLDAADGRLLNGNSGDDEHQLLCDVVGGDDFAEYLLVADYLPRWKRDQADGFRWLVVEVMPDGETFAVMTAR